MFPKRLQAKTTPTSSPCPYLSASQSRKQVSVLSGMCPCGSQSRHPLAAALSFRIWGALLSASTQWLREPGAVLHGVMVGSREAHVPREWLLHTSFREAEVPPLLLQTTRLLSFLSACPHFKCLPQNFLHDLMPSPSYGVLASASFDSSLYLLPSFGCHL